MPAFLDGQQNLAALTVPGVYGDIILPQPNLLGTPTNIEGLVGVGSWGQLNSQIPISKPADAALLKTCFPCHEPIRARDFVFTEYAP